MMSMLRHISVRGSAIERAMTYQALPRLTSLSRTPVNLPMAFKALEYRQEVSDGFVRMYMNACPPPLDRRIYFCHFHLIIVQLGARNH